jgi:hypothetical protein
MIQAHYIEVRSQKLPGEPATTIIREVDARNGKGRKTIRVLRGDRVVSSVSESLTPADNACVQKRKFAPGLYRGTESKTMKNMGPTKRKATKKAATKKAAKKATKKATKKTK